MTGQQLLFLVSNTCEESVQTVGEDNLEVFPLLFCTLPGKHF